MEVLIELKVLVGVTPFADLANIPAPPELHLLRNHLAAYRMLHPENSWVLCGVISMPSFPMYVPQHLATQSYIAIPILVLFLHHGYHGYHAKF